MDLELSNCINSRFQQINEIIAERFEDYDRAVDKFQSDIFNENTNFTDYLFEQMDLQHKNTMRLIDLMNADMTILKEKSQNFDLTIKTIRNDLQSSLLGIEEFYNKKYEHIFKSVHITPLSAYSSDHIASSKN